MLHIKSNILKIDTGLLSKENIFIKCLYLSSRNFEKKRDVWALYQVVVILSKENTMMKCSKS